MFLRFVVLVSTIAFIVVTFTSGRLFATERRTVEFSDLVAASDLVVVGTVESVDSVDGGPSGRYGIHTRTIVHVERAIRGSVGSEATIWIQGGRIARRARAISGQARFAAGERILLFTTATPDRALWPTGMALGKWAMRSSNGLDIVEIPVGVRGIEGDEISLDELIRLVAESPRAR